MKRFVLFIFLACCLGCFSKHPPKPDPTSGLPAKIVRANPKLGAYALLPRLNESQANILGQYFDLVITGAEDEINNPGMLDRLHQIRPEIVQLPYLSLEQFPEGQMDNNEPSNGPVHKLHAKISSEMWLYTTDGKRLSNWPGAYLLNLTAKPWRDLVISVIRDRTFATHPTWRQGIYFDDTWWEIAWASSNIDADRDGQPDPPSYLNNQWSAGVADVFYRLRQACPNAVVISQNGANFPSNRMEQINGVFFEDTLKDGNDLTRVISKLQDARSFCRDPKLSVVNVCGEQNDLGRMRSGLALATIFDAHYFYDQSVACHCTLWTYPEYTIDLGAPTTGPTKISDGFWRRDFQNGLCVFNASGNTIGCDIGLSIWNAVGQSYGGIISIEPRSGLVLYKHRF